MANPEHVEILKKGVEVWNRWREDNPEIEPDLSGEDLEEIDLRNNPKGIYFIRLIKEDCVIFKKVILN